MVHERVNFWLDAVRIYARMRVPRRGIVAVSAGILMAIVLAPVGGAAESTDLQASSTIPDDIVHAMIFRAAAGLESGESLVRYAAADAADYPVADWGIPLSNAEAAELDRRAEVQLSLDPAVAFAESQEGYAGAYIDQAAGGVPVFMFKDPPAGISGQLSTIIPTKTEVRVEEASRTLRDLEALRTVVYGDRSQLKEDGIALISTGIDTRNNKLLVGVENPTTDQIDEMIARYGPGISVRADEPSFADTCTVDHCWPQKGGIEVHYLPDPSVLCTSGYVVRYGSPVQYGLLTAGHCGFSAGGSGNWAHVGSTIGSATGNTYFNNATADVTIIKMNASTPPSILNQYVRKDAAVDTLLVVTSASAQLQGGAACMSGWGSQNRYPSSGGELCGHITIPDMSRPSCLDADKKDCVQIQHEWELDFDSTAGDSGGPIHLGNSTGFGILTDSVKNGTGNRCWYSTLTWAMSALDLKIGQRWRVCLNSSCSSYW